MKKKALFYVLIGLGVLGGISSVIIRDTSADTPMEAIEYSRTGIRSGPVLHELEMRNRMEMGVWWEPYHPGGSRTDRNDR